MASEVVEIEGHIIDSLILAKVMDVILAAGADYRILEVDIGKSNIDTSRARIEVTADNEDALASLLVELQVHGANRMDMGEAELVAADADGVLPPGFYATTNLPTRIRLGGRWLEVENPEMDCALIVRSGEREASAGAGPDVARLVRDGWIDVLFAGNGFATHDIEANVMGTSLGMSVQEGVLAEGGHSNHLRVINEVRRYGSIAAAVDAGYIDGGVMYECVRRGVPFVLGGSVRDDGPLPDVYTNVVEAADAMRYLLHGVTVALMLASTLHAIATGNLLPSGVETYCVDINQAVVTKLADRGSHQALGIVTDVGLFTTDLCAELCGGP